MPDWQISVEVSDIADRKLSSVFLAILSFDVQQPQSWSGIRRTGFGCVVKSLTGIRVGAGKGPFHLTCHLFTGTVIATLPVCLTALLGHFLHNETLKAGSSSFPLQLLETTD